MTQENRRVVERWTGQEIGPGVGVVNVPCARVRAGQVEFNVMGGHGRTVKVLSKSGCVTFTPANRE